MEILLDKNKRFFKANLHCHSTCSDGSLTVEELKSVYQKNGYSVVAFTDHEHLIDHSYLTDENFLAITACEIAIKEFPTQSTLKNWNMRVCHLNFYSLNPHNTLTPCYASKYDHFINPDIQSLIHYNGEYERVYTNDGINEMIKIANEQGFIVSYNHPTWSLENTSHYLGYKGLFAVEIYNHSCYQHGFSCGDEHAFEDLLRAGNRIYCTAADDNHNYNPLQSKQNDSCGGWVCINAEKLEYNEVMSALQKGNFYASTGPQIFSLVRSEMQVEITCSPAQKIDLITRGRRTDCRHATDEKGILSASFPLKETDGYFRLRITDNQGKIAYTQAYYLE